MTAIGVAYRSATAVGVPPPHHGGRSRFSHSLVLKADGTLWTFGHNEYGQLGTTTNNGTDRPEPNPDPVLTDVAAIAAAGHHSLALKTDGTLWTFGYNQYGQLGTATNSGTGTPNPTPTQILTDVAAIAAGVYLSLALKTDGTLWTFGNNFDGQLGTATNNLTGLRTRPRHRSSPTSPPSPPATSTAWHSRPTAHCGPSATTHTANRHRHSGTGTPNPTPTQVLTDVAAIDARGLHSLVFKTDGTLWTFGYNNYGQLGTPTNNGTRVVRTRRPPRS